MAKTIKKISPAMHGHVHVDFSDGSMKMFLRTDKDVPQLEVGTEYPFEEAKQEDVPAASNN